MDVATIIKERRARLGLSQQDLAEFAEVGIATVKDIERGKGNPSLHTLQKIMAVLGLEMIIRTKRRDILTIFLTQNENCGCIFG